MKQEVTETNNKVKELIKEFNELQNSYLEKSYDLLKEIFELRKTENPNYNISDLENEEGLEEHKDKIKPLLKYSTISEEVKGLQEEGKLSNSEVFLMANLPREMKDKKSQSKIAELLINGSIKTKELIGSKGQYLIMKMIGSDKKLEFENKILLRTIYQLKEISNLIIEHKEFFSNKKYKKQLIKNFKVLKKSLNKL